MSLESWKEEFYPVEASDTPKSEAIAHSLRKWRGLQRANLERHEVAVTGKVGNKQIVSYDGSLDIDSSSCALCAHYTQDSLVDVCAECPLSKARDGVACDQRRYNEEITPYEAFTENDDPEPMIRLLEYAMEREGEEE